MLEVDDEAVPVTEVVAAGGVEVVAVEVAEVGTVVAAVGTTTMMTMTTKTPHLRP